jgi:Mycothiol maleylpyruvate isomerase N-terminal domain
MPCESNSPEPILCAHQLRTVDEKLIDLLSSLTVDDWDRQTVAPSWRVRDVVAHLLDTTLRKLSMARDCCYVETVNTR